MTGKVPMSREDNDKFCDERFTGSTLLSGSRKYLTFISLFLHTLLAPLPFSLSLIPSLPFLFHLPLPLSPHQRPSLAATDVRERANKMNSVLANWPDENNIKPERWFTDTDQQNSYIWTMICCKTKCREGRRIARLLSRPHLSSYNALTYKQISRVCPWETSAINSKQFH